MYSTHQIHQLQPTIYFQLFKPPNSATSLSHITNLNMIKFLFLILSNPLLIPSPSFLRQVEVDSGNMTKYHKRTQYLDFQDHPPFGAHVSSEMNKAEICAGGGEVESEQGILSQPGSVHRTLVYIFLV